MPKRVPTRVLGTTERNVEPAPIVVKQSVPCPRCERGRWTDSNGARWRCSRCAGTGRVVVDDG